MTLSEFIGKMNHMGQHKVPFLFIVDFELNKPLLIPLAEVDPSMILYDINGVTNAPDLADASVTSLSKFPESIDRYKRKFEAVYARLEYGDSFLTNLTVRTEIKLSRTLKETFYNSTARYKLLYEDQFLVFSPEIFVQISKGTIRSFPMKGTIDAAVPLAEEKILADRKELSEHVTIVDLIRNDLSQIAHSVHVEKFRYVEKVKTNHKSLLQVSSIVSGTLDIDFKSHLGDIMVSLLPAGSVTGAPKSKTVDIIRSVEGEERGYYTGVFGMFDGTDIDSGVMIRFIERSGDKHYYRSGGGITTQSELDIEYQELIDKVYVPVA